MTEILDVTLTAKVKTECIVKGDNVTADLSGEFDNANAGDKTVNFRINSLGGTNCSNYKLGSKNTGSVKARILPMVISFISGTAVFRYDGEQKTIEPSAFDSLGRVFDDFEVEYYDSDMKKA